MPETALIFLLAYSAGLLFALVVKPLFGLYVYVAVFYLDPPSRWWGSMLPDVRWALVAAAVTFLAILIHRKPEPGRKAWYSSTIVAMLILYTAWMWIQWPWAISPSHSEGVVLFSKYLLLIYMLMEILDNEKDFRGFCLAHVIGCGYLGWLIFMAPDGGRLDGIGGAGIDNANTLSMHLGTGLMFAAFTLLIVRGWQTWLVLLAIPLIVNGIVQTETRGAVIGLILGGLATIYLKPRQIRGKFYALSALAALGFLFVANEAFLSRVSTLAALVDEEQEWDNSAQSRIELLKSQVRMFKNNPLGAGHQGTAALSRDYLDERWLATNSGDRASHNTVMSIVVDQGVPGIVLFSIVALSVVRVLRELKKMDLVGLPYNLALYRTMIGGALCTYFGAGMFAQFLKAEVLFWCLTLLVILWRFSQQAVDMRPMSESLVSSRNRNKVANSSVRRESVSCESEAAI